MIFWGRARARPGENLNQWRRRTTGEVTTALGKLQASASKAGMTRVRPEEGAAVLGTADAENLVAAHGKRQRGAAREEERRA